MLYRLNLHNSLICRFNLTDCLSYCNKNYMAKTKRLEQVRAVAIAQNLQNTAKGFAMNFARAVLFYRFKMGFGAVAGVFGEAVFGVDFIEFRH